MNEMEWVSKLQGYAEGAIKESEMRQALLDTAQKDPMFLIYIKNQMAHAFSYKLHSISERSELSL